MAGDIPVRFPDSCYRFGIPLKSTGDSKYRARDVSPGEHPMQAPESDSAPIHEHAFGRQVTAGNGSGRPLYGVFFVKEFARAAKLSFVGFLVRSQSPFLRPDLCIADVDARRICTSLAVTPTLRHASPLPGHTLTASSTTAR